MGLGDKARLLPGHSHRRGRSGWRVHPDTTVLEQETGLYPAAFYAPEEDPQAIYYDYFNAPETMFPVPYRDDRLETKDVVLGVQLNDSYKAYSSAALRESSLVNDVVGGEGDTGAGVDRKPGREGLLPRR